MTDVLTAAEHALNEAADALNAGQTDRAEELTKAAERLLKAQGQLEALRPEEPSEDDLHPDAAIEEVKRLIERLTQENPSETRQPTPQG